MSIAAELQIDHLMWAAADLAAGVAEVTRRTGCAPNPGGAHPGNGTCNALLGLGDGCYFEIIAPDPAQSLHGTLGAELALLAQPRLRTWAMRSSNLDAVATELAALGVPTEAPRAMSRRTVDGGLLQWRLMFVKASAGLHGVLPFFIAWGASAHPAKFLDAACALESLTLTLPDGHPLAGWLARAPRVRVETGRNAALTATLVTPLGRLRLS